MQYTLKAEENVLFVENYIKLSAACNLQPSFLQLGITRRFAARIPKSTTNQTAMQPHMPEKVGKSVPDIILKPKSQNAVYKPIL
jgi:hypothetical protein